MAQQLSTRAKRSVRMAPQRGRLAHGHDVVDLHEHAHVLRGQRERAGGDQQRLHHVCLQHVGHAALLHVQASVLLALGVQVAQLGHDLDGVQAGVLGQRVGNDLRGRGQGGARSVGM